MQGAPWVTLHAQSRHHFTARHQSAAWALPPDTPPCRQFRLVVHRVRDPGSANSVQLACLRLWGGAEQHVSVQLRVDDSAVGRVSVQLALPLDGRRL